MLLFTKYSIILLIKNRVPAIMRNIICYIFLFVIFIYNNSFGIYEDENKKPSYIYNKKKADVYIGGAYAFEQNTIKGVNGLINIYAPEKWNQDYGGIFNVGIRPLDVAPYLRSFRFEAEISYHTSKYPLIYNAEATGIPSKETQPKKSFLALSGQGIFNAYIDLRIFDEFWYPYVGVGAGKGNLKVRHIDFQELPNGVGEQYFGTGDVGVTQFMVGFQWDNKIIKASAFIEYRYILSGKIDTTPNQTGYPDPEDPTANVPSGYSPPKQKSIGFEAHSILVGIKYYLY